MNTTIKTKLNYLKSLPFPAWADNDALSDWQAELAGVDGYVAGLASRVLGGENPDTHKVAQHVHQLQAGLEAIDALPAEDHVIRTECEAYLEAIADLAQSLCK